MRPSQAIGQTWNGWVQKGIRICVTTHLAFTVASGCTTEQAPNRSAIATDDRVVAVSRVSVGPELPRWLVGPDPELRMGVLDGDPAYQFFRIVFAATLTNGRIVVADGDARELRFFSGAGELVQRVGGRGQGPGEFEDLTRVFLLPGDSLLAWDASLERVTKFAPDGSTVGTRTAAGMAALIRPRPPIMDGRLIAVVGSDRYLLGFSSEPDDLASRADGDTVRFPYKLVITGPDGSVVESVAVAPGVLQRLQITEVPSPAGPLRVTNPLPFPSQLTGSVIAAGSTAQIAISKTDEAIIHVFDANGRPTHLIELADRVLEPVSHAIISAYDQAWYQVITGPRDDARAVLVGTPMPTHSALLIDADGNLWVRDPDPRLPWFGHGSYEIPRGYLVLAKDTEVVARAELPRGLEVFHISATHVTGRLRDDFGVEYVAVYRIRSE
jgi:hypothetical protein